MNPLLDLQPLLWPILVLVWLFVVMRSRMVLHRRWDGRSRAVVHGRPVPSVQPLRSRWARAVERYDRVAGEYAAYESDPLRVLRAPALADPAVPSTGRFIEAFAEAMALRTDEFPPEPMARRFIDAAVAAEQAWTAARDAAEKLRASRFTTEERGLLAQAVKLLELARGGATPAEQEAAYAAARQVLAKLERSTGTRLDWRVPKAARQAIERHGNPPLPPA
ncbi:hypothetical protein FHX82_004137 [Amycolatopsis bartoniae]|uniref:Uncharacterized protein n=1 Tax=Amycolatopsis bartoniae TaxID=941986 RepID=A0A8H9IZT1_9PSEU|nr:hypothetical protein [Amycolatopsis bartoniae]MBB2937073.1 hypothetical protein [Amycolatopsis bartoniae]TVT04733.1 hypothetical protein FNH07_23680 [Amycolatopsis bartoniae]GHF52247.1 hypothetical protein GCM10017566_26960 [Amycolatopsis bartoniae]